MTEPLTVTEKLAVKKTEPCPHCGRELTTIGGPRSRHIEKCKRDHGITNINEAAKPIAESPKESDFKPDKIGTDNAQLRREVEIGLKIAQRKAEEVEQARKTAPDIEVAALAEPSMLEATEIRLRKKGIIGPDWHFFAGDRELHAQYPMDGYVAVIEDGVQVAVGDTEIWKCPQSVYEHREAMSAGLSRKMLRDHFSDAAKKHTEIPDTSAHP